MRELYVSGLLPAKDDFKPPAVRSLNGDGAGASVVVAAPPPSSAATATGGDGKKPPPAMLLGQVRHDVAHQYWLP